MMETASGLVLEKEACAHCGEAVSTQPVYADDKVFCCTGCKSVYELLYANNLCTYCELDKNEKPGLTVKEELVRLSRFAYLDEEAIGNQLLNFQSDTLHKVLFHIPGMHCSSCIWLLENLFKLDQGVLTSRENFPRREVSISCHSGKTQLSKVVGEMIYAGGLQVGESIELEGIKEVSQSYLTQLWNNDIFRKDKSYFGLGTYADKVGSYFSCCHPAHRPGFAGVLGASRFGHGHQGLYLCAVDRLRLVAEHALYLIQGHEDLRPS